MDTSSLSDLAQVVGAIVALATLLIAFPSYINFKSRTEKMRHVREVFQSVVGYLGSPLEAERLAGAILLRRFFDPESELGQAGTPYAKEAISVISAILRTQQTGNYQKLLADSLAYAPALNAADLQRTNLQMAYLSGGSGRDGKTLDFSGVDFYRADLSGASLRGVIARRAVFYQARLHNTVFRDTVLEGANFYEADLKGANFDGALLEGANFRRAINLPPALAAKLDANGNYQGEGIFRSPKPIESAELARVFVSKPGITTSEQQHTVNRLLSLLEQQGFVAVTIDRTEYPSFGVMKEVRRAISGCAGAVILGFKQMQVHDALWREGTSDQKNLSGVAFSTPWNQIEAGMAAMLGLPLLVLRQENVREGVFDIISGDDRLYNVDFDSNVTSAEFDRVFRNWCSDVRECSVRESLQETVSATAEMIVDA